MRETRLQDVAEGQGKEAMIGKGSGATENPINEAISEAIKDPVLIGRALDASVAGAVMGWRHYDHGTIDRERRTLAPPGWAAGVLRQDYDLVPPFSTDLAAAWTVAEALAERGWQTQLMNKFGEDGLGKEALGEGAGWHCAFIRLEATPVGGQEAGASPAEDAGIEGIGIQGTGIQDVSIGVSGRTAAEAICRAALGVAEFLSFSFQSSSFQFSSQGGNSGGEIWQEEAGQEGTEGKLP
jgi:hypothetical protein